MWLDFPSTKLLNVKFWTREGLFSSETLSLWTNVDLSNVLNFTILSLSDSLFFALIAFLSFALLLVLRIPRYSPIVRDRMIAFSIFSFFTIFFWAAFEQGAGSLPIFTRDYTNRILEGNSASIFKIIDLSCNILFRVHVLGMAESVGSLLYFL